MTKSINIPNILIKKEVYEPGILTLILSIFIINGLIDFELSLPAGKASANIIILSLNEYPVTYVIIMSILTTIFLISFVLTTKGVLKNITRRSSGTNNP